MASVKKVSQKSYCFSKAIDGLYIHAITAEDKNIRGGSLFFFGKKILTVSIADTNWLDEKGLPYGCKVDDGTLFIKRCAIKFF